MEALYEWRAYTDNGRLIIEGEHPHDRIIGRASTPAELEGTIARFRTYDTVASGNQHTGAINETDVIMMRAAVMRFLLSNMPDGNTYGEQPSPDGHVYYKPGETIPTHNPEDEL